MKFKPTEKAGGLVVELGPRETQLPPLTAGEALGAPPVFKLKKILVPVDYSECSKKALQYAIPFAKQFGAELALLHVVPSNPPVPELGPVDVVSYEDAAKDMEALRTMVSGSVTAQGVLRTGEPHVEIIHTAKELGVDLIILSTHGRTGLARVLLGSTAEKVVRHAGCPVLVVRENEHEFLAGSTAGSEASAMKDGG